MAFGGLLARLDRHKARERKRQPVVREPRCGDEHGVVAPSSSLLPSSSLFLHLYVSSPSVSSIRRSTLASFRPWSLSPSPRRVSANQPEIATSQDEQLPQGVRRVCRGCDDGVGGVGGGDGDTASGEKRDEADQVEGERLLSGRGE